MDMIANFKRKNSCLDPVSNTRICAGTLSTELPGPHSRPNPHLKFVEVPGIEPIISWLVVRLDQLGGRRTYIEK